MPDHVHMLVSIPPKYSVAEVIGFIKGKSSIWIAQNIERAKNFTGHKFWARGYFVSTPCARVYPCLIHWISDPRLDFDRLVQRAPPSSSRP